MNDRATARSALINQLRARTLKPVDETIADYTDIYRDLGINGQDLWEVFAWAAATYNTDCSSVTPKDYDINEPPRWISGKSLKSVTIAEILDAIERGRWITPP